VIQWG